MSGPLDEPERDVEPFDDTEQERKEEEGPRIPRYWFDVTTTKRVLATDPMSAQVVAMDKSIMPAHLAVSLASDD